jgi:hypothetical protein
VTLTAAKVGGWSIGELLTSDQVDHLQAQILKAVDGIDGGTYTLSAALIIAGDTVRIDEELYINAGAELISDGPVHFRPGAPLLVSDGFQFDDVGEFNGTVGFSTGGIVNFAAGNTVVISELGDLTVDSDSHIMRLPMTAGVPHFTGGTSPSWIFADEGWLNLTNGSLSRIWFALPVMAGDVITEVRTSFAGGSGAGHGGVDPTNKARFRLMEMGPSDSTMVALSTRTSPATGASYDAAHFVDLSGGGGLPYTALDRQYFLEVRSEFGGTAADNENLIRGIFVTVTRNQLVSTNVFGS